MNNFDFRNRSRIQLGKGRIADLKDQVPQDAKVIIVYGGGSAQRTGVLAQVREALAGRTLVEFSGFEPNPRFDTALMAVELIGQKDITFLIVVDGGSVIDATKFIAAAALYNGDAWDNLTSRGLVVTAAIPFGTVLTRPATGSEMEPEVTYSLPPRQIVNGVDDAFIHTTEQYLTYPAAARVQDGFAETLLWILIELGPKALETPEDYDILANLMWTATLAVNDTDHTRTLAGVLQYAANVWDIHEGSEDDRIDAAIDAKRGFFEAMRIKTRPSDHDVAAPEIDRTIIALKGHRLTAHDKQSTITTDDPRSILEAAL